MAHLTPKTKYRFLEVTEVKERLLHLSMHTRPCETMMMDACSTSIAVSWAADPDSKIDFGIINYNQLGIGSGEQVRLNVYDGHSEDVTDVKISPFYDRIVASTSFDGEACIWRLPDQATEEPVHSPIIRLKGHTSRVYVADFNPVCADILSTGGCDKCVRIWNMNEGKEISATEVQEYVIWEQFKPTGDIIAATCLSGDTNVVDVRSPNVVQHFVPHEGKGKGKLCWASLGGAYDHLITTGKDKNRRREAKLWDSRNLSECVASQDGGDGVGILIPYFDSLSRLLFLVGKGDSSMAWYAIKDNLNMEYINNKNWKTATKGFAWLPKRDVDVMNLEIMRGFRMESTEAVVPISFRVTRKVKDQFQADLYDGEAYAGVPAISMRDWLNTPSTVPIVQSMDPEIPVANREMNKIYDIEIPKSAESTTKRKNRRSKGSCLGRCRGKQKVDDEEEMFH